MADEFDVASDMLTRTSVISDVAPDASVFPRKRDPETGGRQLEQLAFEVVSTESLGHAGRKAAKLVGRGVRRVFAIDVERVRAFEWSRELATWGILDSASSIADPALAVPLPVGALVHAATADDAIAAALLAKRNPVLVAALAESRVEGRSEGRSEGMVAAVLAVIAARDLVARPDEHALILAERDPGRLERWLARAVTCASVAELLAVA